MRAVMKMIVTATIAIGAPGQAVAQTEGVPPAAENLLPPPYVPKAQVSGVLRIWGHGAYGKRIDFVERLMDAWEEDFRSRQPGIVFDNALKGTAAAMAGLYTGKGDIALMGREVWDPEIAAFREVKGYAPTGIDVMTGSFNVRNRGYALTVFVHKDNPIRSLTLAQLDAVFGSERRRGHKPVRTWGDLGLGGEWKNAPVHLYGLPIARGFADFFQDRVFLGSQFWNPSLREFPDDKNSVSAATDGAVRMLAAMADDRFAIGYAGLVYSNPATKAIALAETPRSQPVMPTLETVRDRSYPLTRLISFFVDKAPGKPLDPKAEEFIRYVLSREGQRKVERFGAGYLPMLAPFAAEQIRKLEN